MDAYALMLSEAAAMTLAAASRAEQRQLAVILDEVKSHPFRPGDLHEHDTQRRVNEVLVVGDWVVTYWPDHAARELRVINLERVED